VRCIVIQCVNVLQYLQCVADFESGLMDVAVWCNVLPCGAVCCSVCSVLQRIADFML